MKNLILLFGCLISLSSLAAEQNYEFDDPDKRAMFLSLTAELRCPMCQNQNIADSDAMIAHDLRRKVYQLVQQGKSREEIVEYMKARYGDFISYQPPVTPATVWLWLLPLIFVLLAIFVLVKSKRKQTIVMDESKLARAEQMLDDNK